MSMENLDFVFLWTYPTLEGGCTLPWTRLLCLVTVNADSLFVWTAVWSGGWNRWFWSIVAHTVCTPCWFSAYSFSCKIGHWGCWAHPISKQHSGHKARCNRKGGSRECSFSNQESSRTTKGSELIAWLPSKDLFAWWLQSSVFPGGWEQPLCRGGTVLDLSMDVTILSVFLFLFTPIEKEWYLTHQKWMVAAVGMVWTSMACCISYRPVLGQWWWFLSQPSELSGGDSSMQTFLSVLLSYLPGSPGR